MSGAGELPDDETLAGEYVLGVLTGDEAARCAERRKTDPVFDRLVTAWEARLMPATLLVAPVSPPPELQDRIEAAMRPAPVSASLRALRREVWAWRGVAGLGTAVACALGWLVLTRPVPAPQVLAVLLPPGSGAGGFVVREQGASVRLEPLRPPAVPAGRDLELWSLAAGSTVPPSLGVLPSTGKVLPTEAVPEGDVQLLVSVEPSGGSPSGAPTGPVVLAAELHRDR